MSGREMAPARAARLFAGAPPEAVETLLRRASVIEVAAETLAQVQDAPATHLHILIEGQVEVFTRGPSGKRSVRRVVQEPGAVLTPGALGLARYPDSCRALLDSRLVAIPMAALDAAMAETPELGTAMLGEILRQQEEETTRLAELKTIPPFRRLAGYLADLAPQGATGPLIVHLPIPRVVLAALIGITPENLSRDFVKLRTFGVSARGAVVSIHDVARLRAFHETGVN